MLFALVLMIDPVEAVQPLDGFRFRFEDVGFEALLRGDDEACHVGADVFVAGDKGNVESSFRGSGPAANGPAAEGRAG